MALINCKECGVKISDKAAICVHCGAPLAAPAAAPPAAAAAKKKPKPWTRWVVPLIAVVVVIFGLISAFPEQFESMFGLEAQKPAPVAPAPPSILVSAIRLSKDYKTNEALADIAYKGKSLVVNGEVDAFNKNTEAPSVTLSAGAAKAVQAQFPKSAFDKLITLKHGQKVTVTCVGGGVVNGSPILKACTLSLM